MWSSGGVAASRVSSLTSHVLSVDPLVCKAATAALTCQCHMSTCESPPPPLQIEKSLFQNEVAKRNKALAHHDVALTRIFPSWPRRVFKIARNAFRLSHNVTKLSIIQLMLLASPSHFCSIVYLYCHSTLS